MEKKLGITVGVLMSELKKLTLSNAHFTDNVEVCFQCQTQLCVHDSIRKSHVSPQHVN